MKIIKSATYEQISLDILSKLEKELSNSISQVFKDNDINGGISKFKFNIESEEFMVIFLPHPIATIVKNTMPTKSASNFLITLTSL